MLVVAHLSQELELEFAQHLLMKHKQHRLELGVVIDRRSTSCCSHQTFVSTSLHAKFWHLGPYGLGYLIVTVGDHVDVVADEFEGKTSVHQSETAL